MPHLQATWTPEGLLFWSSAHALDAAIAHELPSLRHVPGERVERVVGLPSPTPRRRRVEGKLCPADSALSALCIVPVDAAVSDSIKCWSRAALLALELAARQRVFPSAGRNTARWRALLARSADRERFQAIVASTPVVSRAAPTQDKGPIRLMPPELAVRGFLDAAVDGLYRQDAYPGSARGWALEYAEALRGERSDFTPRDARAQGVPQLLASWSGEAEATGLRVGFTLSLPHGIEDGFALSCWLHPTDRPDLRVDLDRAWSAGAHVVLGGKPHAHPAHATLRDLSRAARLFPPLLDVLRGPAPRALTWDASQAWDFLQNGVRTLREAGFEVDLPDDFAETGGRRVRARMCIEASDDPGAPVDLSQALSFRWEVVLGDTVVDGDTFAELTQLRKPIVRYRDAWVLLDPAELARLPEDLAARGTLSAAEALRAVLTGTHDGIPVVADDRLAMVIEALRAPPEEPLPSGLEATLRPYQRHGYSWLSTLGGLGLGACLADDMGLGKTVQVIAYLLRRMEHAQVRNTPAPFLVVCPTSLLGNWTREIRRFAPSLRVLRFHGMDRDVDAMNGADVVLTTYGLLVRDQEALAARRWDVVVLDEAQAIKNPDAKRAQAARSLDARHRVALSGTPVENRLDELWSLVEFLVPGLLGTRGSFRRSVAVPIERFGDEDVARRLKLGVSPFLLRRVKTDPRVIDDLPDKMERNEWCGLTPEQAALYQEVVDSSMAEIAGAETGRRSGRVLAMLTALKQVCNHPAQYLKDAGPLDGRSGKLARCADLVQAIVDSGERALLFTQYREMGELLQRHLGGLLGQELPFLHGGTPAHRREELVDAFQNDDHAPPILLVSLKAGGTGLNLTRATHVLHYDRWWNPAVEDQATDRAYRIGQRKDVQVHKFVCQDTLEERIDTMLQEKRALAEQVVGKGERWVSELDDDALRALVTLGDDAVMEA